MTSTDNASRHRYGVLGASAAVVVAGTIGLVGLADAATESDGLAAFDPDLTAEAVSHRTPVLTAVAQALTFIGNTPVLVTLTVVAALILWRWTRTWRAPVVLLAAMIGSSIITNGLKALIERSRPDVSVVLGPVTNTFAFPSGHTVNSTVFFITLAALAWSRVRRLRDRTAILAVAVLMSIGIGLSRVYLGYHWATDVLAGWVVAIVWLAVVLNVASFVRERSGPPADDVATYDGQ